MSLKLSCSGVIKRVRDAPGSFEDLNRYILSTICKKEAPEHFKIQYKDEAGDWIDVNDDDDLLLAYEDAH